MGAPNFNNDQLGFPLYVHGDVYSKVCPECGAWNMDTADVCEECGENLENVDARYDAYDTEYLSDEVWSDLRKLNEELTFFAAGLSSGYYSGLQFDVDWKTFAAGVCTAILKNWTTKTRIFALTAAEVKCCAGISASAGSWGRSSKSWRSSTALRKSAA